MEAQHRRPAALTLPVAATLLLIDELLCDIGLYLVTLLIFFFVVLNVVLINVVLDDIGRCGLVLLASPRIRPCDS